VIKSDKNSFGLLELEMADLEHFWRKTPLGHLGVKEEWWGNHHFWKKYGLVMNFQRVLSPNPHECH
jgi:hypothetical protein